MNCLIDEPPLQGVTAGLGGPAVGAGGRGANRLAIQLECNEPPGQRRIVAKKTTML
jgi:hypothetical protein